VGSTRLDVVTSASGKLVGKKSVSKIVQRLLNFALLFLFFFFFFFFSLFGDDSSPGNACRYRSAARTR
jgi:hypothetical protein